jgi:hypothetical protein
MTDQKKADHGQAEVAEKMQADLDKGFHGEDNDPLKPDGYTLRGSVARSENK